MTYLVVNNNKSKIFGSKGLSMQYYEYTSICKMRNKWFHKPISWIDATVNKHITIAKGFHVNNN